MNAKTLSTFLGHASITVTLDRYGHQFPGSEAEAAGLLDAYLARADKSERLASSRLSSGGLSNVGGSAFSGRELHRVRARCASVARPFVRSRAVCCRPWIRDRRSYNQLETARKRAVSGLSSGGGGIRTLEPPNRRLTVFETAAFNHSATPPGDGFRLAPVRRPRRGRRRHNGGSRLLAQGSRRWPSRRGRPP